MHLTDREKELIKGYIDRGEPLPAKYKLALFADAPEVELIWQGKTSEVTNIVLPFQSIEQIDEPRQETGGGKAEQIGGGAGLFAVDEGGRQSGGWSNKLIWGDNKLVLSSLKNGPMRKAIEDAGGLRLVYIDPPFDVGADFSVTLEVGDDEEIVKEPSLIEELAYRDTWGRGVDSYLSMISERLNLARGLMASNASIYVHVGKTVSHVVRALCDSVFGRGAFANEITWKRSHAHGDTGQGAAHFGRVTESILLYRPDQEATWNPQYAEYTDGVIARDYKYTDPKTGEKYRLMPVDGPGGGTKGNPHYEFLGVKGYWRYSRDRMQELYDAGEIILSSTGKSLSRKKFLKDAKGTPVTDLWDDVNRISPTSAERIGYATQKPEVLLERVVATSSNPGDLVMDFFCGSGTTLAVAEKLGRKWIGCDLGRFAIHTTRKRLIGVQRQLKAEGKPYRSFEILNLGKYERQYFVGIDPTLPEEERRAETLRREEHYLNLILTAYKAERAFQSPPFHGKKNATMVVVGPIDAPVTQSQVAEVVAACAKLRISKVDVLGFEFEMGLAPQAQDDAKAKGVTLSLKYIPKDVFDKRAVEKGQVKFYDVAYVEVKPRVNGKKIAIELTDFGVFYQQDAADEIAGELKPGGSRVTVEAGQVVKVSKDKKGVVTRERLTKKWTDWIDYWAVDFDYESRPEFVRIFEAAPKKDGEGDYREVRTGGYVFENEWQSFRTRKDRTLELRSAEHEYPAKGRYKVAVKVIDIFGNDTTKVVEVRV